jgi:hypothetical protein
MEMGPRPAMGSLISSDSDVGNINRERYREVDGEGSYTGVSDPRSPDVAVVACGVMRFQDDSHKFPALRERSGPWPADEGGKYVKWLRESNVCEPGPAFLRAGSSPFGRCLSYVAR